MAAREFTRRQNNQVLDVSHINELQVALEEDAVRIDDHLGDKSNPHNVTAPQLGVYLDTEVDNLLSAKANSVHDHDERYYTKAEVVALIQSLKAEMSSTESVER